MMRIGAYLNLAVQLKRGPMPATAASIARQSRRRAKSIAATSDVIDY
jgi:hypothetical protein